MKSFIMFCFLTLSSAIAQDVPVEAPAVEETAPVAEAPVADAPVEAPAAEVPVVEEAPPADAVPTTDEEAVQVAVSMVEAFKAGQIPFGVGLALTLLVYLVNRFGLQNVVPEKVLPVLAFAVGVAGATGSGLVAGVPVLDAVLAGMLAGVAAIGGWEAIVKMFTPAKA